MHSILFPMAKKYFRGNESDSSQYLWLNGCSSSPSEELREMERGVLDGVILGTGGRRGFEIESGPQHWHSHYGGLSLISRWSSSEYRRHKGAYFTMRISRPSWQYWTFKLNYSDYFDLGHRRYGCCVVGWCWVLWLVVVCCHLVLRAAVCCCVLLRVVAWCWLV